MFWERKTEVRREEQLKITEIIDHMKFACAETTKKFLLQTMGV